MDLNVIVSNSKMSKLDARHFLNIEEEHFENIFDMGLSQTMEEFSEEYSEKHTNITNHLLNVSAKTSKINTNIVCRPWYRFEMFETRLSRLHNRDFLKSNHTDDDVKILFQY